MRTRSFFLLVGLATAMGACAVPGEEPGDEEQSDFELKVGGCAIPGDKGTSGIPTAVAPRNSGTANAAAPTSGSYANSGSGSSYGSSSTGSATGEQEAEAESEDPGDWQSSYDQVSEIEDTSAIVDDPNHPCQNESYICYEYETTHNNKPLLAGICAPPPRSVVAPLDCASENPCDCPDICQPHEFCAPLTQRSAVECFVPLPAKARPWHGPDALAKTTPLPEEPNQCVGGNGLATADTKKKTDKKADPKADPKKTAKKPADMKAPQKEPESEEGEEETEEEATGGSSGKGSSSGSGGTGGSKASTGSGSSTTGKGTGGAGGSAGTGTGTATGGTATGTPPTVALPSSFSGCFCPSTGNPATSPCAVCQKTCTGAGKVCVIDAVGKAGRCVIDPKAKPASTPAPGTTPAAPATAKPPMPGAAPMPGTAPMPAAAVVTFNDVKSIFATKCKTCHSAGGSAASLHTLGDGPADLDKVSKNPECEGSKMGACAVTRIESGTMPLGKGCAENPAGPGCPTPAEIAKLQAWAAGGFKK